MATQQDKARAFKALHEARETFVIPNPWDGGSAKLLQEAGAKALATTSAGFARTLGRDDGEVTLEEKLGHCREIAAVTDIPVTVDFENGFADAPNDVAVNIIALAATGVVGGSIEDWSGDDLYDQGLATERVAAAVEAVSKLDFPFLVTARAEGLLRNKEDLDTVIGRLKAYEEVGAQVLYAPGLSSVDEIKAVLDAVSRPVNVLGPFLPGVSLESYQELGVARVSVGGALYGAVTGFVRDRAKALVETGHL